MRRHLSFLAAALLAAPLLLLTVSGVDAQSGRAHVTVEPSGGTERTVALTGSMQEVLPDTNGWSCQASNFQRGGRVLCARNGSESLIVNACSGTGPRLATVVLGVVNGSSRSRAATLTLSCR